MTMNEIRVKKVGTEPEKTELFEIWSDLFGDSDAYISDFYATFPIGENAFVALCGERVVGIVNSLECRALLGTETFNGRYIYALALKKEFRGQGIAKKLLAAGEGRDFTMLVPESPELFEMYDHLGYTQKTRVVKKFLEPHKESLSDLYVSAAVKSENKNMKNAEFFI